MVTVVEHAQPNHHQGRPYQQSGGSGQGTAPAGESHAHRHREIDDVAARQELAEAEQFGEFLRRQPAPLLHQVAPRQRQHPAEGRDTQAEET